MARIVLRVAGALLAAVTALVVATASPALAHNELESSNPDKGATLDTAPTAVVLTFAEALIEGEATFIVTGPDGADASGGPAKLSGSTATVPFTPTAAGAYTVTYKVIADDGDVSNSSFRFTLTAAAVPSARASAAPAASSASAASASAATSAAASTPAASTTGSGGPWWPYLVGALVLIAIVVALILVVRRRR
jgi:methionine-rich copper-binding protein CopC